VRVTATAKWVKHTSKQCTGAKCGRTRWTFSVLVQDYRRATCLRLRTGSYSLNDKFAHLIDLNVNLMTGNGLNVKYLNALRRNCQQKFIGLISIIADTINGIIFALIVTHLSFLVVFCLLLSDSFMKI
jgi:hypothetical protein